MRLALRAETMDDVAFDALLTPEVRRVSPRSWTPVPVATTAARWLESEGARRVLDVGSGVGKFCVVAASVTSLRLVGVERKVELVAIAEELASRLGVTDRVAFVRGELHDIDLSGFDALYFYNPLVEQVLALGDPARRKLSRRAAADVAYAEGALAALPIGTMLVTYHGFGGLLHEGWDLLRATTTGAGRLCCWRKRRDTLHDARSIPRDRPSAPRAGPGAAGATR
jgi:SAM-dependent methyltransferase